MKKRNLKYALIPGVLGLGLMVLSNPAYASELSANDLVSTGDFETTSKADDSISKVEADGLELGEELVGDAVRGGSSGGGGGSSIGGSGSGFGGQASMLRSEDLFIKKTGEFQLNDGSTVEAPVSTVFEITDNNTGEKHIARTDKDGVLESLEGDTSTLGVNFSSTSELEKLSEKRNDDRLMTPIDYYGPKRKVNSKWLTVDSDDPEFSGRGFGPNIPSYKPSRAELDKLNEDFKDKLPEGGKIVNPFDMTLLGEDLKDLNDDDYLSVKPYRLITPNGLPKVVYVLTTNKSMDVYGKKACEYREKFNVTAPQPDGIGPGVMTPPSEPPVDIVGPDVEVMAPDVIVPDVVVPPTPQPPIDGEGGTIVSIKPSSGSLGILEVSSDDINKNDKLKVDDKGVINMDNVEDKSLLLFGYQVRSAKAEVAADKVFSKRHDLLYVGMNLDKEGGKSLVMEDKGYFSSGFNRLNTYGDINKIFDNYNKANGTNYTYKDIDTIIPFSYWGSSGYDKSYTIKELRTNTNLGRRLVDAKLDLNMSKYSNFDLRNIANSDYRFGYETYRVLESGKKELIKPDVEMMKTNAKNFVKSMNDRIEAGAPAVISNLPMFVKYDASKHKYVFNENDVIAATQPTARGGARYALDMFSPSIDGLRSDNAFTPYGPPSRIYSLDWKLIDLNGNPYEDLSTRASKFEIVNKNVVFTTKAYDKSDNDQLIEPSKDSVIVDEITFDGFVEGKDYKIIGRIFDKKTGKEIANFLPKEIELNKENFKKAENGLTGGSLSVEYELDTSNFAPYSQYVITYDIYEKDKEDDSYKLLGYHKDLRDDDQTFTIRKKPPVCPPCENPDKPDKPTPEKPNKPEEPRVPEKPNDNSPEKPQSPPDIPEIPEIPELPKVKIPEIIKTVEASEEVVEKPQEKETVKIVDKPEEKRTIIKKTDNPKTGVAGYSDAVVGLLLASVGLSLIRKKED